MTSDIEFEIRMLRATKRSMYVIIIFAIITYFLLGILYTTLMISLTWLFTFFVLKLYYRRRSKEVSNG